MLVILGGQRDTDQAEQGGGPWQTARHDRKSTPPLVDVLVQTSTMPTRHEITLKRLLFAAPPDAAVTTRRDLVYRTTDAGDLTLDLYAPAAADGPTPAIIFVVGYSDLGARSVLGCAAKDMASFIDWARLVAAAGMTAITYANAGQPVDDLRVLLRYVAQNAASLRIDASRLGLWACSGHVPTALAMLTQADVALTCAALAYGYAMDLDGATSVADASKIFRFADACAGKSIDDLPGTVPIFIARAGRDEMPGLNFALDRFTAAALARNLPVALANHPTGPHAFDLFDDSAMTRAIVRQTLAFLTAHLT